MTIKFQLVLIVLVTLLVGLIGEMDYNDAILQQSHYCRMVEAELHPAYNPDIKCK